MLALTAAFARTDNNPGATSGTIYFGYVITPDIKMTVSTYNNRDYSGNNDMAFLIVRNSALETNSLGALSVNTGGDIGTVWNIVIGARHRGELRDASGVALKDDRGPVALKLWIDGRAVTALDGPVRFDNVINGGAEGFQGSREFVIRGGVATTAGGSGDPKAGVNAPGVYSETLTFTLVVESINT
jgi:hypothetical protein